MAHCPYLETTLAERHPVVVPMGMTALRRVLHLEHKKKVRVQDFHGSVQAAAPSRMACTRTFFLCSRCSTRRSALIPIGTTTGWRSASVVSR